MMHKIESSRVDALRAVDLNLLVVLIALLEHGSVTAASVAIGRSPSATSHALARLRHDFQDALFVRKGNHMVPTPRASSLRPILHRMLDEASLLYRSAPVFDPSSSQRQFTLAVSDLAAPLLPQLFRQLSAVAPGVRLRVVDQLARRDVQPLLSGAVDLALQPKGPAQSGLRIHNLGSVHFAVLAQAGHAFLRNPSLDAWCSASHVTVETGRPGAGFVAEALREADRTRTVALLVPSFLLAMHVVAETQLLFSAPRHFAQPLCGRLDLRMAPLPLPLPEIQVTAVWHERFEQDAANLWLRRQVLEVLGGSFAKP